MADRSLSTQPRRIYPSIRTLPRFRPQEPTGMVAVPEGFRHPLAPATPTAIPTLLPLLGVNDDVSPAMERLLVPIAVRAQDGDWAARDALYIAFEPKLMRIVRKIHVPFAPTGSKGVWERDDVIQEAYLVFVGVVASWSPEIPFGRYVLAHFPWRLRDAIHRGVGRRNVPPRMFGRPIIDGEVILDPTATLAQESAIIAALAASFEPPLDDVLRLHVLEEMPFKEIAETLGVSRRSTTRYWKMIRIRLRESSAGIG